jgi:alanine-glyoxylate transaminase/serine-glyoxylate transaminase/serine-pyruvate transaminase
MPAPYPPLESVSRILLGPGPSPVPASVLSALGRPTVGHLDPFFLGVMDELRDMLRAAFQTQNTLTLAISGTGSAGMEATLANLLEPGDRALIGVNGVFGGRMLEIARRLGAEVTPVQAEWGRPLQVEPCRSAAQGRPFKVVCVVHAETSTGVLQPLEPFKELADELGALLVVDAVTSLGGMPVEVDRLELDAVYSGTQKCLSCPPGLSPVTFSERASRAISARRTPVVSWYLDLSLVQRYWGSERVYHHTAPINMLFALHEALRLVLQEGLDARFARHRLHHAALSAGLAELGLGLPVAAQFRLPSLTVVEIPDGIDDLKARRHLLHEFGLEIGGGLGPMQGRAWRIGLMGEGASRRNVELCLAALTSALRAQGYRAGEDALAAARATYS